MRMIISRKLQLGALALAVTLNAGTAGTASAQIADFQECRSACIEATSAAFDICRNVAGPARGLCRRAARAYKRCCIKKFCRNKIGELSQCVRSQF